MKVYFHQNAASRFLNSRRLKHDVGRFFILPVFRLTIPEFAPTEAKQVGLPFTEAEDRLTIPEFAPTEALHFKAGQFFGQPASRFLNSRRLKLPVSQGTLLLTTAASRFLNSRRLKPLVRSPLVWFTLRLTIPEFAPTEAGNSFRIWR